MRRFILLFVVFAIVLPGCGVLTPAQRCELLKTAGSIGTQFAFEKWGSQIKAEQVAIAVGVLENQMLPILRGERGVITREQLDQVLETLDKSIPNDDIKRAIQAGINSALVLVKPLPTSGSIAGEIVDSLRCLFEGVLNGFKSGYNMSTIKAASVKTAKPMLPVKLHWVNCCPK